ncbi:hypothetical protein ACX2QB_05980 [Weissella viridescens]|jgi:hypothetical protein
MENALIDIYNSNTEAGNSSFKLDMHNFDNTSATQIQAIYARHGIKADVTMNWGFYTVDIIN